MCDEASVNTSVSQNAVDDSMYLSFFILLCLFKLLLQNGNFAVGVLCRSAPFVFSISLQRLDLAIDRNQ